jgi:hypothetical protein
MADTVEGLIYAEAQRGLALQPVLLNELRARTGILLVLASASTAFLGGIVVDKQKTLGALAILALAAWIGVVFCCYQVLSPRRKWEFAGGAAKLIQTYCDKKRRDGEAWSVAQVQRDLALHIEAAMNDAIASMKSMQEWYVGAGFCLLVEVVLWLIAFAQ